MSDLTVAGHEVLIPKEARDAVLEPSSEDFLNGLDGSYAQSFAGAEELMSREGDDAYDTAYFIPAVRFFLRVGLDLLADEEISSQLSKEVEDRKSAAHTVVNHMAGMQDIGQVLQDGYDGVEIKPPAEGLDFNNENTLAATAEMTNNVFNDVSLLAGGALKLLMDQGISDEATEIIQRSYGLLRMARVSDIVIPQIHKNFGYPYINTNYLITTEEDNLRVRFTEEMLKMLIQKGYINEESGCPVAQIRSGNVRGNIMQEGWREVSGFLVPAGATVDNYKEVE